MLRANRIARNEKLWSHAEKWKAVSILNGMRFIF